MAKSANLYARIEPEVKEQAEAILSALGIPASNAITMFYKQVILQRGLPFEVKLPEHPLDISRMTAEQLDTELEKGYEVTLTPEAKHDLREIYRYIAVELQSEQNANGQLDRLEENILKLDEMPERFRVYDREPWHSRNLRVMPVDNYLVFYIPDHQVKTVTVLRIMYGGRDIDAQLRKMQGN